jgi:xanthine dehydrogenase accessory factor
MVHITRQADGGIKLDNNEYIARTICDQFDSGLPLVLVSIVSWQGSAPRHSGAKMVVGGDGKSYGTIGGSLLEATAVNESRAVLSQQCSRFMNFNLTGDNADSKDMICGGKVVLLLDFIPATKENTELFRCWYDAARQGNDFYFLTLLRESGSAVNVIGHSLFFPDGKVAGNYSWSERDMETLKSGLHNLSSTTVLSLTDIKVIIDPIRKTKTLYCVGAGHVAVPTAHIAALAGFRVVVVDDRPEFATAERFPEASDIIVRNFDSALAGLDIDNDSFVVILTRGHQYDRAVLAQALKTNAGYIGLIGSRKKQESIYTALMAEGVICEELDRVHSPIGLSIGAETPEEIAVSIVAELISERLRQKT